MREGITLKTIRKWLLNKILPIWARSELEKEIERLTRQNQEQEAHIRELNAYADGLEYAIRHQQITINHKEVRGNEHNTGPVRRCVPDGVSGE